MAYNSAMTTHAPKDPYAFNRINALKKYASLLSGSSCGLFLVVSQAALTQATHNALDATCQSLAFPCDPTYLSLAVDSLSPDELFVVVESLDPLVVIAADKDAVAKLRDAFNQDFVCMQHTTLFGREARAFESLNELLSEEKGKQTAWALLKTMPTYRKTATER